MEVKGITQKVYPKESGVSKTGKEWSKQGIVITVQEKYPYSLFITDFNDKAGFSKIKEGDTVTVSANVSSREYNDKWYTNVMAWRVEVTAAATTAAATTAAATTAAHAKPDIDDGSDEDLPF